MAPTELLAEQHARNFRAWLEPLGLRVALLTGRLSRQGARARSRPTSPAARSQVAVGTHALFQEDVAFRAARAGDRRRAAPLRRAPAPAAAREGRGGGRYPHQLVMTATPIPRTLAMTAYADLDVSIIDELPPGRTPIKTVVLPDDAPQRDRRAHRHRVPRGPPGVLGLPADRRVGAGAVRGGREDRGAAGRRAARACGSASCTGAWPAGRRTRS